MIDEIDCRQVVSRARELINRAISQAARRELQVIIEIFEAEDAVVATPSTTLEPGPAGFEFSDDVLDILENPDPLQK